MACSGQITDSLNYFMHTLGVSGFILHNDACWEWLSYKELCWCFPIWPLRAMWSEVLTSTQFMILSWYNISSAGSFLLCFLWSSTLTLHSLVILLLVQQHTDLHSYLTAAQCSYSRLVQLNAHCHAQGHLSGCCSKRVFFSFPAFTVLRKTAAWIKCCHHSTSPLCRVWN